MRKISSILVDDREMSKMSEKNTSRQSSGSSASLIETPSLPPENLNFDQDLEAFLHPMSANSKVSELDETGSQFSPTPEVLQVQGDNNNHNDLQRKGKNVQEVKPLSRDKNSNNLSPIPSIKEDGLFTDNQSVVESRYSPTETDISMYSSMELNQPLSYSHKAPWDFTAEKEQKNSTNQKTPTVLATNLPKAEANFGQSEVVSPNNSGRFDSKYGNTLTSGNASAANSTGRQTAASLRNAQQKGYSVSKSSMTSAKNGKSTRSNTATKVKAGQSNNSSKIERLTSRDKLPQLAEEAEARMDKCQRDVLRRKRPLLADTLDFSPEMQKVYREHGILKPAMLAEVLGEKTDYAKMFKFLELIPLFGSFAFDALCDILEELNHSWLSDELYADLIAERGDLEIEEYIYREAGVLVHKQFGTSKRISEVEKKEVQLLMSVRYQSAKEAYKRQLSKAQRELESALMFKYGENGRMKEMLQKIRTFVRIQRPRINSQAHDIETALDFMRDDPDPENKSHDYFHLVDGDLDKILDLLARILLEKENLEEERKRCMKILNLDKPVVRLDAVLEEALRRAAEEMNKSQTDANINEQIATSLDSQMKSMQVLNDKEMAAKDRHIMYLESLARQREEKLYQLDRLLLEIRQRCDVAEDDAEKWKRRCEMVEKTRRLGYYYPKWFDELYEIEDLEYHRDSGDKKLVSMGPMSRSADNIPKKIPGGSSPRKPVKLKPNPTSGKKEMKEDNGRVRLSYQSSKNI